jgi:hypothetical protein
MFRGDRAYSPWWRRLRLLSSVLAALSFTLFFILAMLKMDGRSAVGHWSWASVAAPTLSAMGFCILVYCVIHYFTRHTAFTYTSDAAASYLLGIRTRDLDFWHQTWVFRDCLLGIGFLLLCILGIFLSLLPCENCNTPYSLLSIGAASLYALRVGHLLLQQAYGFRRMRLMILEVSKFQEFLDQHRLFNQVLPDLYSRNKEAQKWLSTFFFLGIVILAVLGSIWIDARNCASVCAATYLSSKYLLYGMYALELFYFVSTFFLVYLARISGVETIENLIERLENENKDEKRKQFQLLRAEQQRRQNDSTSTR